MPNLCYHLLSLVVSVKRIDDTMSSRANGEVEATSDSKGKGKPSSSDKGSRSKATNVLSCKDKASEKGAGDTLNKAVNIVDDGEIARSSTDMSTECKMMSSKVDALAGTVSNLVAPWDPYL